GGGRDEAAFEKPVHGPGGEHEDALQPHRPRPLLDALEDLFAVALALALRRHGQRRHLARLCLRVGIDRGAGEDHAVVFDDGVVGDVALDLGAVALDQGAVLLERLDQLQDAADVVGGRLAQLLQLLVDHHGADPVVHVHLQQQRPVGGERDDVAALHAALARLDAMLQVERRVGRLLGVGQAGQQLFGRRQRQLGVDRVVFAFGLHRLDADTGDLGQENQLVGLQRDCDAGGDLLHREIEGLAGRREPERRHQHHRAEIQRAHDAADVDFAHQAGMLEIDSVEHADRPGRDEVAGYHAHGRAGHRRIGQPLTEGRLDFVAQLTGRFLGRVERHFVGDAHAVRIARLMALGLELFCDLRPEAVHQHDLHAHALDQREVLGDVLQLAGCHRLAGHADDESLAPVHVDVRRHRSEPGHESKVEDGGHRGGRRGRVWRKCKAITCARRLPSGEAPVMVRSMDAIAIGFWGAFFGSAALMLAGALAAFARSLRRVALTAALASLVSALFVVAYLGWLPISDPAAEARLLAHVAVFAAVMLGLMLLAMLGLLRRRTVLGSARVAMIAAAAAVLGAGWLLDAAGSLALGSLMAITVAAVMLVICIGRARQGDRLAWVAVSGVSFLLIAVGGLSLIALHRAQVPWQVHVASAIAAIAYLASMAAALWTRYSYLIELREAVAHGPSYDPVTRMRSHAETGQMVGLAFFGHHDDALAIG